MKKNLSVLIAGLCFASLFVSCGGNKKAEVKGEKLDMPNLYEISNAEKEALEKVSKNLNKMQSEISKEKTG